jgi:peptidoglycan hydrolase-like protein with peptidoglycan-binding domain
MNLQGRDLKLDVRGRDVALLHKELAALGVAIPEPERAQSAFGQGTHEAIVTFQRARGLEPTGVVDAETARAVNAAVDLVTFTVDGHVVSHERAGVGGLQVAIVDKNAGGSGDARLAEATTNGAGAYRVTFTVGALRQRGKERPDLQARVTAGGRFLGASDVRYDAANRETLNVFLAERVASSLPSEHETLSASLSNHFGGRLRELEEKGERQDITYLANKTGWDARTVAYAALADQFSARSADGTGPGLDPAFFYALLRAEVPGREDAVYGISATDAEAIWTQAIDQGVIPAALRSGLPEAVARFRRLSAGRALTTRERGGLSPLAELLAVSAIDDPARQRRFAELQAQHQGDPDKFWGAVRGEFGEAAERRLRVDGQLAYLTFNNAPLVRKVHQAVGGGGLPEAAALAGGGFYRAGKWQELIDVGEVPPEVSGANAEQRRARYAEVLAAQVRLGFPTAVVAEMVRSGETPVSGGIAGQVHAFLQTHQAAFNIDSEPVQRYLKRTNAQAPPEVVGQIKRIQRVRQITPSDHAMNALLKGGLDSAFAVTRYARAQFVRGFKDALGGEATAASIHARSQQVHSLVLNLGFGYLTAGLAPGVGLHSPGKYINPSSKKSATQGTAGDVIAYPTLEGLFGELDFCKCDHCRSILSPAAYLVDLLLFLDRDAQSWATTLANWRADHGNAPYPFESIAAWNEAGHPSGTEITPLAVLLQRRPDIQHLPLTCENTNTPLPYIDLVNETLEYFLANDTEALTLTGYQGHSTEADDRPEELLASPQFVRDSAYETLAGAFFPPPLPFHQPLENLRRHVERFETSLPEVMEKLRPNDSVERPAPADPANPVEYGIRDILMEELQLSRAEHKILTNSLADPPLNATLTLQQLYGFDPAVPPTEVIAALSRVKDFTRRVDVSFEEIVEILKTRFVNPGSTLIPKLERLRVPFSTIKALHDGDLTADAFGALLPLGLSPAAYGGDPATLADDGSNYAHVMGTTVEAWVAAAYDRIMGLVTIANPTKEMDLCSFDNLEFRYSDPDMLAQPVRAFEFVRLVRFIRLWKKIGWTIDQTDKAIAALYPADQIPDETDDVVNLQRLNAGFLVLLPRLAVVRRLIRLLKLKPKKDLLPLLACFAPIDTHGASSLYRQMFLTRALLKQDPAFDDDGFGGFLTDVDERLLDHAEAIRAACTLTVDELAEIAAALGFDEATPLTLDNVSAVFRTGWLARKLKLSVRELLLLTRFTGIDPFAAPDPASAPILDFVDLVGRLRAAPLKPTAALYLIWNQDLSGRSAPADEVILELARTLRASFTAIESEFALMDDPDGLIARSRMSQVYDGQATDRFFGLLEGKVVSDVSYSHATGALEQPIVGAGSGHIAYDDLRKRLAFDAGVMPDSMRDALKAAAGNVPSFHAAVDELYAKTRLFFDRYPELLPLYEQYATSNEPVEQRRLALLAAFLPELKRRRKRQQALQTIATVVPASLDLASALLDDAGVLHGAASPTSPALDDLIGLEAPGLSAVFFFAETASGTPVLPRDAEGNLAYLPAGDNHLPPNGNNPAAAISGIWTGYLEAPENGFYNLRIEADAGATVGVTLDGRAIDLLPPQGGIWTNEDPIELRAGTLHPIVFTVEKVKDRLVIQWETAGRGREVIPPAYLYSGTLTDRVLATAVRCLKATTLTTSLRLAPAEIAHVAAAPAYAIGNEGWLNRVPVSGNPDPNTSKALLKALAALLHFARLKAALSPDDDRLLRVLQDPPGALETTTDNADSLLLTLTRWDADSLAAVLARFGKTPSDLGAIETFARVHDAFVVLRQLRVPASALIAAATNAPGAAIVRDLQAALRARYDESDWLKVLQPINDDMRALQRDALVAYILHQMRAHAATRHIDTADKLFEYFLMDVQMAPCMQTSRIRHALSSVQLFIERSLMNLEPRVVPSVLEATHWGWMKRYRVWEANRKVYLWPENWLDPELRDFQSPFFKEAMSELLQSDITLERAEIALLNYLSKLEEVAKLEPCGIHFVEGDTGTSDDVAHVVARTPGAKRKYFYRRREYGAWTPWEQIKLDIEDNPVLPVVWTGRLFLFWVRILKQAPLAATPSVDASALQDIAPSAVIKSGTAKETVLAVLCWSEYHNGKWQPTRTSDVAHPLFLQKSNAFGPLAFDRSQLTLSAMFWTKRALRIIVSPEVGTGASFFLHNVHSAPERRAKKKNPHFAPKRRLDTQKKAFKIRYPTAKITHGLLNNAIVDRAVQPNHPLAGNSWDAPFLYDDARHVFYVTTKKAVTRPSVWSGYHVSIAAAPASVEIPPIVLQTKALPKPDPFMVSTEELAAESVHPVQRFVSEDAYIDKGISSTGSVSFGEVNIGPSGTIPETALIEE